MVLKNVLCERVSVSHGFSLGFPPPASIIGFMDALNHFIKKSESFENIRDEFIGFSSIGVVVNRYDCSNFKTNQLYDLHSRKLVNPTGKKDTIGVSNSLEIAPEYLVNMDLDIVLKLSFEDSLLQEDMEEFCDLVKASLLSGNLRFCSGRISPYSMNDYNHGERKVLLYEFDESNEDMVEEVTVEIKQKISKRGAYFLRKEKKTQEKFFSDYKEQNPSATNEEIFTEMLYKYDDPDSDSDSDTKTVRYCEELNGTFLISHADYYGVLDDDLHTINPDIMGLRMQGVKHFITTPLYTLGRWTSIYSMQNISDILWSVSVDKVNKTYEYMNNGQ